MTLIFLVQSTCFQNPDFVLQALVGQETQRIGVVHIVCRRGAYTTENTVHRG